MKWGWLEGPEMPVWSCKHTETEGPWTYQSATRWMNVSSSWPRNTDSNSNPCVTAVWHVVCCGTAGLADAVRRWHPEVCGAGVKNHREVLHRSPQADLTIILGLTHNTDTHDALFLICTKSFKLVLTTRYHENTLVLYVCQNDETLTETIIFISNFNINPLAVWQAKPR